MLFPYKNIMRYHGDDISYEDFLQSELEYINHLLNQDWSRKQSILKYLGFSYFHDADFLSMEYAVVRKKLTLSLTTDNVFEDINLFRENKNLSIISSKEYQEKPIIFLCEFYGVCEFYCNVNLDKYTKIMDTEIGKYKPNRRYTITFSFWENEELSFNCNRANVSIDQNLIMRYTNNQKKAIPFCDACKTKLLNHKQLLNRKKYIEGILNNNQDDHLI